MIRCFVAFGAVSTLLLAAVSPPGRAQVPAAGTLPLIEMTAGMEKRLVSSSAQVTAALSPDTTAPGIRVTIQPGPEAYPGVAIKPVGTVWNLSAYGHVDARFVNTGTKPLSISLRVDNAGDWHDNPWNTESVNLKAGEAGTATVIFGYAYGHKPNYALKPGAVSNLLVFTTKSAEPQSFRIESITAGGTAGEKPPVNPASIRIAPVGGILMGPGAPLTVKEIDEHGLPTSLTPEGLKISFPAASAADRSVMIKPTVGRWDLRDDLEVRLKLRNDGQEPITPRAQVESNGGPSDWAATAAPLGPGQEGEIVVPFRAATIWNGEKNTGNRITNDAVSGVAIAAEKGGAERSLLVESVRADMPPTPTLPDWLGKRPPVPGDWTQTFDDEFSGDHIDATKWNVYAENYWDKASHFSKDDVIMGGGLARLHYEKKLGHQNDDPKRAETAYAAGFLDTYGKWTQRYGYFEARMKLPRAPGLWPAFWMMPDRGAAAGNQGKRQDTANGGMEFDVMEHLDRWGPNRYNIAMHWDGYGKDHKSTGSDKIYVQPDKDGFITCGLLWTPGSLVYYCNGIPVLRWDNPRISSVPEIMMFTLPQGGWDNNAVQDAKLPDDFIVDYVRCWQRKDLMGPDARVSIGDPENLALPKIFTFEGWKMTQPFRDALQPFVENHTLAGAVAVVASKDRILNIEAVGYADIARQKLMSGDALFWIASQTKPITGTALMMLVDEGKVNVQDPVEQYLPEFKDQWLMVEGDETHRLLKRPGHPITISNILTHTSGLGFASPVEYPTLDILPLESRVRSYAMTALESEPDSRYQYSNMGINTAGRIIEVVSGQPYATFLDERLFGPLGMTETTFWPDEEQIGRLAKAYKPHASGTGLEETVIGQLHYPLNDRVRQPMPAGGLFSTAGDVVRFCQMVLNGGAYEGRRYVSETSTREMTRKQTGSSIEEGYGFGWGTGEHGYGHGGALSTNMSIDPRRGLITVFLVQHAGYPGPDGPNVYPAFQQAAEIFAGQS